MGTLLRLFEQGKAQKNCLLEQERWEDINYRGKKWKYQLQCQLQATSAQFSCSVVTNSLQSPWTEACQAFLSITNSQSLLKHMSIKSVRPSNHLILCHPLLLLPSIFPSIRVFSSEASSSHQVAKVLELQLQHQSFQWIFRTDFFLTDLISLKSKESRLLCCWLLLFVPVFAWNVCRVVSCVADSTQATGKAWDK